MDGVGYGFWMPKLRVVGSRICRAERGFGRSIERFGGFWFGRGVERFCEAGSSGFRPEMNGLFVWVSASGERFVPLRCRDLGIG